jgi:hypothetical protein
LLFNWIEGGNPNPTKFLLMLAFAEISMRHLSSHNYRSGSSLPSIEAAESHSLCWWAVYPH